MVRNWRRLLVFIGSLLAAVIGVSLVFAGFKISGTPSPPPIAWHDDLVGASVHLPINSTGTLPKGMQAQSADGSLLVVGNDNALYRIDASSGRQLWRYAPQDDIVIEAIVDDAQVLAHVLVPDPRNRSSRSRFVLLDITDGHELWAVDSPVDVYTSGLAFADGHVYAAGEDRLSFESYIASRQKRKYSFHPRLVAISQSGVIWQSPLRTITDEQSVVFGASLTKAGSSIVVRTFRGGNSSELEVFDAQMGRKLWGRVGIGSPLDNDVEPWGDKILIASKVSIDVIDTRTGRTISSAPASSLLGAGVSRDWIIRGDEAFVYSRFDDGSNDRDATRCLNLATLTLRWVKRFKAEEVAPLFGEGNTYDSRPMSYESGHIYLGARDGFIYGLDASSGSVSLKFFLPQIGSVAQVSPIRYGNLVVIANLYLIGYRT